jgi:hypothetical protein
MVALLPNKFLYATVLVASYAPIVSAFNRRKKLRHEQQVYLYNCVHKKAFNDLKRAWEYRVANDGHGNVDFAKYELACQQIRSQVCVRRVGPALLVVRVTSRFEVTQWQWQRENNLNWHK